MRHNKIGLLALAALTLTGMTTLAQAQDNGTGAPQGAGGGRGGRGGRGGQGGGGFGGAGGGFGGQGGGGFGGGQRGQFGARPIQLSDLSVATMDYGLKLTADQKAQIQTVLTQRATDMKALPAQMPPMPGQQMDDATRQAMQDARQKRTELTNKANTDILAVLTADQKAMLPEFTKDLQTMQQAGIPIAILGDLKLTDGQKKKIVAQAQQSQVAMQEKMRASITPGQRPTPEERQTMMTDMQAMQKDSTDKIMALLTPTQHAMIDDYNRAHPQPAFGGFGGPGGGFGGGRRGNGPGAGQGNGGAGGN